MPRAIVSFESFISVTSKGSKRIGETMAYCIGLACDACVKLKCYFVHLTTREKYCESYLGKVHDWLYEIDTNVDGCLSDTYWRLPVILGATGGGLLLLLVIGLLIWMWVKNRRNRFRLLETQRLLNRREDVETLAVRPEPKQECSHATAAEKLNSASSAPVYDNVRGDRIRLARVFRAIQETRF